MRKVLANDEARSLLELYSSGLTTRQLARHFKICKTTVINYMKRQNVTRRKSIIGENTYSYNKNFFDNINSEEKAYVLGFFYADGYNGKRYNTANISLQCKDEELLSKINNLLTNNKSLRRNIKRNEIVLTIYNKHICEQLERLGCVQNKSFVIGFPLIEKIFYRHFIRGFFDGDGCIYLRKNNSVTVTITTASKNFVSKIRDIICGEINVSGNVTCRKSSKNNDIYCYTINKKKDVVKFLDWIYSFSNIYLQRKHNRYVDVCKELNERQITE